MNPHERGETWELPPTMGGVASRLVGAQAVALVLLALVLSVLPVPIPWGPWTPAVAVLVGSYAWARVEGRRQPELLSLEGVRALTRRVVFPLGVGAGGVYLLFAAARPDQVELPLPVLVAVATCLAVAGGLTGAVLTLCGLDLGRPPASRRPRG